MYHHRTARLAPALQHPPSPQPPPLTTGELSVALVEDFALVARTLLNDATNATALSERERQMLQDFARREGRYPMVTLARFCKLARRAQHDTTAELLPALIRARCIAGRRPGGDVAAAVADAAEQVGEVTRGALALMRDPSRTNRERVSTALRKLSVSTRHARDAVA